jgi:hypothetical protein
MADSTKVPLPLGAGYGVFTQLGWDAMTNNRQASSSVSGSSSLSS